MATRTRKPHTGKSSTARATRDERFAAGKRYATAYRASRTANGSRPGRPGSGRTVVASNKGRIPELIPIRYGRMVRTPFTFYRGAALNMAADLAGTPATGLRVQACGDCHLLNFGAFATPERRIIFDINDLDETLPRPGSGTSSAWPRASSLPAATTASAKATPAMPCWRACARIANAWRNTARCRCWTCGMRASTSRKVLATIKDEEARERLQKRLAKARARSVLEHDFPKLAASGRSSADHQGQPAPDLPPA